jgi:S-adenosylmethionine-dependent methyltransferase
MRTPANAGSERFQSGADKYAAYLETPEGRLRADLSFANLLDFIPLHAASSLRALDLGSGTGTAAIRLAQLGIHVTVLDSSPAMLAIAERTFHDQGLKDLAAIQEGDATRLGDLFDPRSFDVILCHNVLEFVDQPGAVLRDASQLMRNSSALLSVVARNQAGEVLKAAILAGDLEAADLSITAEWGRESLYQGNVRLFTAEGLRKMLADASASIVAQRGVRVLSDYLSSNISRIENYQKIFELERKLGSRPEFAAVARYMQCLARPGNLLAEDGH